jgi:hypothetical protein
MEGIEIGKQRVRKVAGHYAFFIEGWKRPKHEYESRAKAQKVIDVVNEKCKQKGKEPFEIKIVRKYVKAHSYKYSPIYFNF